MYIETLKCESSEKNCYFSFVNVTITSTIIGKLVCHAFWLLQGKTAGPIDTNTWKLYFRNSRTELPFVFDYVTFFRIAIVIRAWFFVSKVICHQIYHVNLQIMVNVKFSMTDQYFINIKRKILPRNYLGLTGLTR